MWDFSSRQQQVQLAGVTLGGEPGSRPTALIGTIFYHGQQLLHDGDTGRFDRVAAEACIRQQEDFSVRTGNPAMLDVVGATPRAMERHLEFAARTTRMPLLLDGTTVEVRQAGLEYVASAGLADRVVYNTIQPDTGDEELQAIRQAGVRTAVYLAYYLADFTVDGRIRIVEESLPRLRAAGITQILVDTCVLDLATLGQACAALRGIKGRLGLPAGAGVHNAVAMWRGLRAKMGPQAEKPCVAASIAMGVTAGADFLLYGPIEDAKYAFPAAAMVDTALSQLVMERGQRVAADHPRYRIG